MKSRNSSQPFDGHPEAARPGAGRLTALALAVAAVHGLLLMAPAAPGLLTARPRWASVRLAPAAWVPPQVVAREVPPSPAVPQRLPAPASELARQAAPVRRELPRLEHGRRADTSTSDTDPPAQATSLRIPPARRLRYALSGVARGLPLQGEAGLDWRHDGRQYEATLWQDTAKGRRVMSSTGTLAAEGLIPGRFGDRPAGGRGEAAAHFEPGAADPPAPEEAADTPGAARAVDAVRAAERADQPAAGATRPGRIRFSGNQPDAPLPEGAQDRLSVLLQLAAQVAGLDRPLRVGDRLDFPVATARELVRWRFRFEGEERLALAGGDQRTLYLRRLPEGPQDLLVEVWLAPALDYLPARWRLTQADGDWLEQRWTGDYPH